MKPPKKPRAPCSIEWEDVGDILVRYSRTDHVTFVPIDLHSAHCENVMSPPFRLGRTPLPSYEARSRPFRARDRWHRPRSPKFAMICGNIAGRSIHGASMSALLGVYFLTGAPPQRARNRSSQLMPEDSPDQEVRVDPEDRSRHLAWRQSTGVRRGLRTHGVGYGEAKAEQQRAATTEAQEEREVSFNAVLESF